MTHVKGKWVYIVSTFIAKFQLFIEAMNMVPNPQAVCTQARYKRGWGVRWGRGIANTATYFVVREFLRAQSPWGLPRA